MEFVFVYGTLRKGFGLSHQLDNSLYVGVCELADPSCVLVMLNPNTYPSAVPVSRSIMARSDIKRPLGELYYVRNDVIPVLDAIEGTPTFYRRFDGGVFLTDEQVKALRAVDVSIDPEDPYIRVWFYGMHQDSSYLDNSLIIPSGDFKEAVTKKGNFGLPFRAQLKKWTKKPQDRSLLI